MATQARATQRKTRWSTPPTRPSTGPHAQPYRRRRPESTTLHRIFREHLETYLALANESDPMGDGEPEGTGYPPLPTLPVGRPPGPRAPTRSVGREVVPLICPACQTPLRFIASQTDPEPVSQILAHIGEPTSPPPLPPARGPPQTEFSIGPGGANPDEVAQGSFPDDLNQNPTFDPTEPQPIPDHDFDQSGGA